MELKIVFSLDEKSSINFILFDHRIRRAESGTRIDVPPLGEDLDAVELFQDRGDMLFENTCEPFV
jgi:hypothetical protein